MKWEWFYQGSLGSLKCVCKELYARFPHKSLKWSLESPLVGGSQVRMFDVFSMYVHFIMGGLKDHLGVPREGA